MPRLRVVFRVAAGPRQGFGHLSRATVLARALGATAHLSLRGGRQAAAVARARGWTLASGSPRAVLARLAPDLLVIDDPRARAAASWLGAARAAGVPVASIHDLGREHLASDLTIDGSLNLPDGVAPDALVGPRHAVIDPAFASTAGRRRGAGHPRVLVALGAGPRRRMAGRIARAIRAACPDARVRVAGGFVAAGRPDDGIEWLPPLGSLRDELGGATVAVVGGGVTLYEACAAGVPTVGVWVVSAQRPTVRAGAHLGAVVEGGDGRAAATAGRVAREVAGLLDSRNTRESLAIRSRAVVDGLGTGRVVAALRALAQKPL